MSLLDHPDAAVRSLREIEALAWDMIETYLNGWTFDWDRAVRRAGCCHHGTKTITLSRPIFTLEENRENARNTLLHEIAHALVGAGEGHGPRWRAQARALGIRPERCHNMPTPKGKVQGHCGCETPHQRHRMPPHGTVHRCRRCAEHVLWRRV